MTRDQQYFVYILASKSGGTLYVGVTNDLIRRAYQHRNKLVDGFTKQYGVTRLVWYETHTDIEAAITREKQMKKWNRAWKVRLIEESNSNWDDLYTQVAKVWVYWMPAFAGMTIGARPTVAII